MFGKVSTLPIFHTFPSFIHVQNIATWQHIHPHHQIFYYMARYIIKLFYICGKKYIYSFRLTVRLLTSQHCCFDMWQHMNVATLMFCYMAKRQVGRQVQYKTMCRGSIQYETPMLFVIGFIFLLTIVGCNMLTIIDDNCFTITLHKGW